MSTPRHPAGTLRLPSRPQTQLPASPPAGAGTTPAAKSASALPDPAEIAARKQANVQREREQQRAAVFRRHQQTRDILALLRARWPALFTTPVPLATGIARAIRAELGYVEVPTAGLGRALYYWTRLLSGSGVVGRGHATKAATRAPSKALPRRRALCTNWKKPR